MTKPTQRRDAARSRTAILNSAETLFSRFGYERVSIAGIATLAGVSRGLPSYFFGGKANLHRAVMERAAAQNRRVVLDVIRSMEGSEPRAVLRQLVDRYIEYLAANPRVVRLLQWEALESTSGDSSRALAAVPPRVFREASDVLSECLRTKRLRGLEISDFLLSIVAMCLYPFQVIPGEFTRKKAFVQQHKRHVAMIALRAAGGN